MSLRIFLLWSPTLGEAEVEPDVYVSWQGDETPSDTFIAEYRPNVRMVESIASLVPTGKSGQLKEIAKWIGNAYRDGYRFGHRLHARKPPQHEMLKCMLRPGISIDISAVCLLLTCFTYDSSGMSVLLSRALTTAFQDGFAQGAQLPTYENLCGDSVTIDDETRKISRDDQPPPANR